MKTFDNSLYCVQTDMCDAPCDPAKGLQKMNRQLNKIRESTDSRRACKVESNRHKPGLGVWSLRD